MRVLVTGSSGMLGCSLVPVLSQAGHIVVTHGRSGSEQAQADLADPGQTCAMLDQTRPEVIVNLVALANVDACEESPQRAYQGNVRTVANLAAWVARQQGACHLVHVSTDHLYDSNGPHREDAVELTNYYAFSKYSGELAAALASATVIRTNFFGPSLSPGKESFSDWLLRALSSGQSISVFEDVLFSPLSLTTLSELIELVVRRRIPGTYNVGCKDGINKADFAYALAHVLQLPTTEITRASVRDASLRAYRPRDMRMDSTLFAGTFGIALPTIRDEIELMRSYYGNPKQA